VKIFVQAKPASCENIVEKIDETHFKISVTEMPIKGRANLAIKKLLAEYFKTAPSNIELIHGYTSKQKVFEININEHLV